MALFLNTWSKTHYFISSPMKLHRAFSALPTLQTCDPFNLHSTPPQALHTLDSLLLILFTEIKVTASVKGEVLRQATYEH